MNDVWRRIVKTTYYHLAAEAWAFARSEGYTHYTVTAYIRDMYVFHRTQYAVMYYPVPIWDMHDSDAIWMRHSDV